MIAEVKNTLYSNEIKEGYKIPEKGIVFDFIDAHLQDIGMQPKWSKAYRQKLISDWNTCNISLEQKLWAVEHGFLPSSILLYGLTKDNYHLYLSDVDYWRIHPLNNHFAFWINDKITLKNIFAFPIRSISNPNVQYYLMPEYYLYIENDGHFSYLMDSPLEIKHDKYYLLNLLRQKKILALKPSNGGGGYGFVKLEFFNGDIYWNNSLINESELLEKQLSLNGYIVTEYLRQHKDFDNVCNQSTCTLRVLVVKNIDDRFSGGSHEIIASYARFGTAISQGACNMHAGAVAVSYDSETGQYGDFFFRYKGFADGGQTKFLEHPDSKISLKGKELPNYETVKDVVLTACCYLSSLEYFGVDVVITDNNEIKILEINSLPAMSTPQVLCGPMFTKTAAKTFFERKLTAMNNSL